MPNLARRGAILVAILASACSGGSSAPTTPTQSPTTTAASASFAGNYTLTVEIDEACAVVPQSERVRRYDATVDASAYVFPSDQAIRVVGGGFKEPTTMGRFFSVGNSRSVRLDWNELDIGCDTLEPLRTRESSPSAGVVRRRRATRQSRLSLPETRPSWAAGCTGSHRFTFVRHDPW
jgi:hypothetical protein